MLTVFTDCSKFHLVLTLALALVFSGCMSEGGPAPTGIQGKAVRSKSKSPQPTPAVSAANRDAFEKAIAAIQEGQMGHAEPLLLKVTRSQPELAGPWVNLGQVYIALGDEEEARMAFNKAITANPQNCEARNQMGVLLRKNGDFSDAEFHYRECLKAIPDYKDALLNLGILYELYLGRLPEALAVYKQYQQLVDTPDRKVDGWVMDLQRRIGA